MNNLDADKVADVRSWAVIFSEMLEALRDFVRIRIDILKNESQEKLNILKMAIPAAIVGALLLATAYLLFTAAIVGLVAAGFGNSSYRWVLGFLIVGVVWACGGATALFIVRRQITQKKLMPQRTIHLLKSDAMWLQKEAKG